MITNYSYILNTCIKVLGIYTLVKIEYRIVTLFPLMTLTFSFSWPCIFQWFETRPNSPLCPVCKAGISKDKVVPIYGHGNEGKVDPRLERKYMTMGSIFHMPPVTCHLPLGCDLV